MICKNCGHKVTLKKGVCPDCEQLVGPVTSEAEPTKPTRTPRKPRR